MAVSMCVVVFLVLTVGLVSGEELALDSVVETWPSNTAVKVGQEGMIRLRMRSEANFAMFSTSAQFVGTQTGEMIYLATPNGGAVQEAYKTWLEDIPAQKYDLRIKEMDWVRAGKYSVAVVQANGQAEPTHDFQVTAVDDAQCSLSKSEGLSEGDLLNMDCSVRYTGEMLANMEWRDADGNIVPGYIVPDPPVDKEDPDRTTPSPSLPKARIYRANITAAKEHDRRDFTCHLSFDGDVSHTDNCTASFEVRFAVTTLLLNPDPTPDVGRYKVGDTINATAIGNPDPTFSWVGSTIGGPIFQNGPTLMLTPEMVGGINHFTCKAKNNAEIEVEIARNISFHVTHSPTSSGDHVALSAGLMWIVSIFIISIVRGSVNRQ